MSQPRACPHCGTPLPADAPDGLCPKCLIQLGFESQPGPATDDPTCRPTVYQPRSLLPSLEELAAKFPHLEMLEPIGQGGMGVVYKARQKDLDRIVALKILRPDFESEPTFAERFVREARALAKLSHPAIVTVHDFGRVDGYYYFLMEYIDGVNLRELERSGKLPPKQALAIIPQICEALQYAHDQGVVHRDIKPENILIDSQGRVKIADFGLAKMVGAVPEATTLTGAWQVMGTPQYMAPEQRQGSHSVDHRADIYSLGVVIYEMLTGELPVGRFPLPSQRVQVDVRLDEVVLRTLEREPERRYQQASEVKSDLETITGVSTQAAQRMFGHEYRSKTMLLGVPLVHLAFGLDPMTGRPQTARGIIAIGHRAIGGLAIGGGALGGIAIGGMAVGMVSLGGLSLGLLAAVGGLAIGGFACGGGALGGVAIGGMAIGYYAFGGQAWGGHILSGQVREPTAMEFFRGWMEHWMFWLTTLGIGMSLFGVLLFLAIWLTLLRLTQVNAALQAGAAQHKPPPERRIHGPAIGLIVYGALTLLLEAMYLLGTLVQLEEEGIEPVLADLKELGPLLLAGMVIGIPVAILAIVAARRMLRLQSHRLATVSSVLAMLPWGLTFPIGLPVGLWALYVLTRPEVREAFQTVAAERKPPPGGSSAA